jgi:hypothetical protein
MRTEITRYREKMRKRYVASKRHTIQVDFDDYMRELRGERKKGSRRKGGMQVTPRASEPARAVAVPPARSTVEVTLPER